MQGNAANRRTQVSRTLARVFAGWRTGLPEPVIVLQAGNAVNYGLHRDTADIRAIGLPVFSLGAIPTGPLRLDARAHDALESAVVGDWAVSREDLVLGDDGGVLFLPSPQAEEILTLAETIRDTERRQAERIRAGVSLRNNGSKAISTNPGNGEESLARTP
jgi:regulator of RNase E activity RraA